MMILAVLVVPRHRLQACRVPHLRSLPRQAHRLALPHLPRQAHRAYRLAVSHPHRHPAVSQVPRRYRHRVVVSQFQVQASQVPQYQVRVGHRHLVQQFLHF